MRAMSPFAPARARAHAVDDVKRRGAADTPLWWDVAAHEQAHKFCDDVLRGSHGALAPCGIVPRRHHPNAGGDL